MTEEKTHKSLNYPIAMVWLVNGLLCKVLNVTPRHEQIVGRILGHEYAKPLTVLIGFAEIAMAVWVLARLKPRLNAITQMVLVASMNILEFILAPDLLLWGRLNIVFALMFVGLVYYNEFILKENTFKKLL
ncbi:DoxX-like family protein [Olivibacter jilunii]|uniref:DoxX-like family protein n=1 Tax=Olivibacter jilunii TaxID=985016 RepID=UPI003F5CC7B6